MSAAVRGTVKCPVDVPSSLWRSVKRHFCHANSSSAANCSPSCVSVSSTDRSASASARRATLRNRSGSIRSPAATSEVSIRARSVAASASGSRAAVVAITLACSVDNRPSDSADLVAASSPSSATASRTSSEASAPDVRDRAATQALVEDIPESSATCFSSASAMTRSRRPCSRRMALSISPSTTAGPTAPSSTEPSSTEPSAGTPSSAPWTASRAGRAPLPGARWRAWMLMEQMYERPPTAQPERHRRGHGIPLSAVVCRVR